MVQLLSAYWNMIKQLTFVCIVTKLERPDFNMAMTQTAYEQSAASTTGSNTDKGLIKKWLYKNTNVHSSMQDAHGISALAQKLVR